MKKKMLDVLVVEDDTVDYKAVERALARYSDPTFSLHRAETMEKGKRMLEDNDYDAVILDLGLPDVHGMDSLIHFHANAPETPIVVLTGQGDTKTANGAVGNGAEDFLLKSELYPERLEEKLRLAMERHRAKLEILENVDTLERTVTHLERRADNDTLTGLPNRRGLEERMALLRSQGSRMVPVAMVDLDDFKAINDTFGHAVGDRVLAELGRRLKVAAGPGAFVARVGGDEFVVVFHDWQRGEAEGLAMALREAVTSGKFPVGDGALKLTATVALSELPARDLELEGILTLTQERLAHGKQHGKDQVLATWQWGEASPMEGVLGRLNVSSEKLQVLGARVVLLDCMEKIAYRLRFVVQPGGGFIEDRLVDLARIAGSLPELSLACVRKALAWGDGPPYPAIHIDLEIDVMTLSFAEKLLQAVPDMADRQRICFFLPCQFTPEQGEKANRVVKALRQTGFTFGLREAGGGATVVENLILMEPAFIRLSPQLSNGVAQAKTKRERLEQWVRLLAGLKTPLLAEQAGEADMLALGEIGILGAVTAKLTKEISF